MTGRKQEGVFARAARSVRDFFRAIRAGENSHRTLLIGCGTGIPTLVLFSWWLTERTYSRPNDSDAFAVFSAFISAVGAVLAAVVLFQLQEIKTPDAFLRRLIDMLDDAQTGNEFIFIAPSFNVQALPKEDLHERYCEALERAIRKGVVVTLCYCENRVSPEAFCALKDQAAGTNSPAKAAWELKQQMIDTPDAGRFVGWTLEVLDEDNRRQRDRYFENCYSFLMRLRQAGLTDEKVYCETTLRKENTYSVFAANKSTRDFLFGSFTINQGAPQARRVTCIGEPVRSNTRNELLEKTLLTLVSEQVGSTAQPCRQLPNAAAAPPTPAPAG